MSIRTQRRKMAKNSTTGLISMQKRWPLMIMFCIALSTAIAFFIGASYSSCNARDYAESNNFSSKIHSESSVVVDDGQNPLGFMKSKLVLLVSHELSLSGAMIDSHATAEYWKNRTHERLGIKMPATYVVHLGNSKDLMEIVDDSVARRVLREHVRESLGLRKDDLLFAIINSVSRGKGQDLFLKSFYEALQLIQQRKLEVPPIHAIIVGSDMSAQTKFETELRNFVADKKIQERMNFMKKTLDVAPYLASVDVLVQNSQARGECFGRITIEAMAFQLPILGTAAGGTMEIIVNGSTGWLHPVGKEGVTPLANNIIELATNAGMRKAMGSKGYSRVKEMFLEHHMSRRIALVLHEVLQKEKVRFNNPQKARFRYYDELLACENTLYRIHLSCI